jgi:hypothetical protein
MGVEPTSEGNTPNYTAMKFLPIADAKVAPILRPLRLWHGKIAGSCYAGAIF